VQALFLGRGVRSRNRNQTRSDSEIPISAHLLPPIPKIRPAPSSVRVANDGDSRGGSQEDDRIEFAQSSRTKHWKTGFGRPLRANMPPPTILSSPPSLQSPQNDVPKRRGNSEASTFVDKVMMEVVTSMPVDQTRRIRHMNPIVNPLIVNKAHPHSAHNTRSRENASRSNPYQADNDYGRGDRSPSRSQDLVRIPRAPMVHTVKGLGHARERFPTIPRVKKKAVHEVFHQCPEQYSVDDQDRILDDVSRRALNPTPVQKEAGQRRVGPERKEET
jgi:hypothetical protein